MLALEHSRQQQFVDQIYDLEQSIQAPYPSLAMDSYDPIDPMIGFHPLPYSYFENPSMFSSAPMHLKQELPQLHEMPPALISSASAPSIASASSSTVGSPYSAPSHTISSQDGFDHSAVNYGLGVMPTIVNQEAFSHDFGLPMDSELSIHGHDKLSDSFVGECADLSFSQARSSISSCYASQSVRQNPSLAYQGTPMTAPSGVLSINTTLKDCGAEGQPSLRTSAFPSDTHPRAERSLPTPCFKSPTTPASARSRPAATVFSSSSSRAGTLATATVMQPRSSRPEYTLSHEAQPSQLSLDVFQFPFFAQSIGHFIQPLSTSYPSLIHASQHFGDSTYPEQALFPPQMHAFSTLSPSGSPALSPQPYHSYAPTQFSDPMTNSTFYPQQPQLSRRPSLASYVSAGSRASPASEFDEEGQAKGRCPHPECGKVFKDLKAHMLTHQAERPEKCPILTCEYNQKGFARKYDKNRHTLTHYKGTMVCGFCPGSGSPAEKSFNRADVFKRHLTSVHGVEQTPPNSRKRSPTANNRKLSSYCQDATGKCSTCSQTFNNAQDFYEHLDDCVLRVVQQEEPSEAINAQHLAAISSDTQVQQTLDLHMIKSEDAPVMTFDEEDEEDDEDEDEDDDEDDDPSFHGRSGKGSIKSNKHPAHARAVIGAGISKGKGAKKGMTWSKGGVALAGKGRKKREHYPPSWGMAAEKMRMKKRVLCVYDGGRRLWKDDMMLHNEFEVRMTLPDGKNYVTDLDVETMKRAVAFHNATAEEKGPWLSNTEEDVQGFDLNALMA